MLVVVLDERVGRLNLEKNLFLSRTVDAWIIRLHEASNICRWSVLTEIHKISKPVLELIHKLFNSNVAYVGQSGTDSHEEW